MGRYVYGTVPNALMGADIDVEELIDENSQLELPGLSGTFGGEGKVKLVLRGRLDTEIDKDLILSLEQAQAFISALQEFVDEEIRRRTESRILQEGEEGGADAHVEGNGVPVAPAGTMGVGGILPLPGTKEWYEMVKHLQVVFGQKTEIL